MNEKIKYLLLRTIAIIQIFGGIYGLIMTINGLFGGTGSLAFWIVNILSFIFSGLIIIAGTLLWSGSRSGVLLSMLMQLIQIPQFHIKGIFYYIFAGLEVSGLYRTATDVSNVRFNASLGSSFRLSCSTQNTDAFVFGFNLFY
jgi:hypothetical protein